MSGFLGKLFGGGHVKKPPRPDAEKSLYGISQQVYNENVGYGPGTGALIARAENPARDIQRARGLANVDTQAAASGPQAYTPNDPNAGLMRAMAKGSALSKLSFAGADLAKRGAFDSLGAILSNGTNMRVASIKGLDTAAGVSATRAAADMQAKQTLDASRANMYGTIIGAAGDATIQGIRNYRQYKQDAAAVNRGLGQAQQEVSNWGNDLFSTTAAQARDFI